MAGADGRVGDDSEEEVSIMATDVIDEVLDKVAPVKPKEEKEEDIEDIKKRARKPPKDGPCKGCGQDKPLNRLMLCYKCWVKKNLGDRGWKEGETHPTGCNCDFECKPQTRGGNN